jgi:hypothetical protein
MAVIEIVQASYSTVTAPAGSETCSQRRAARTSLKHPRCATASGRCGRANRVPRLLTRRCLHSPGRYGIVRYDVICASLGRHLRPLRRGCVMTVIALAGRRIDAADAPVARFPLAAVPQVREQIAALFRTVGATALVGSGACGADLLAHEVAEAASLPHWMILPFASDRFRTASVTDRPGDWGPRYDRMLAAVKTAKTLKTLAATGDDTRDFGRVNGQIVAKALEMAGDPSGVLAVLVWDGASRGPDDLTAAFGDAAQAKGFALQEIITKL